MEDNCTYEDLPNSQPIVIFSGLYITDTHKTIENEDCESFFLKRDSYNGVTTTKNIDSKVLVTYPTSSTR